MNSQQYVPERWSKNYSLYQTMRQAANLPFLPQPDPIVLASNPDFNRATGGNRQGLILLAAAAAVVLFIFAFKKKGARKG